MMKRAQESPCLGEIDLFNVKISGKETAEKKKKQKDNNRNVSKRGSEITKLTDRVARETKNGTLKKIE